MSMEESAKETLPTRVNPEFESLRQDQETRNEKIVNYIQLTVFILVLLANIGTHYATFAPYKASASLFVLISISLAARIIIFVYLRAIPSYKSARKYVISVIDMS